MYFKISLLKIAVICFIALSNGNAQYYSVSPYNSPYFLKNIVNTILGNSNYERIDVIQHGAGEIRLKGRVDSYYEKLRLYETVIRIPGVREVANEVVVDNPPVSDDILQKKIKQGLIYITSIEEPDNMDVEVNNGIVYLIGNVNDQDEKNTAFKVASLHEGVRGIINKINIRPVSQSLFNYHLRNFLEGLINERYPDEKEIAVSVKDGEVIIEGTVSSEKIKEEITGNISDMEGVTKVNNNLSVK